MKYETSWSPLIRQYIYIYILNINYNQTLDRRVFLVLWFFWVWYNIFNNLPPHKFNTTGSYYWRYYTNLRKITTPGILFHPNVGDTLCSIYIYIFFFSYQWWPWCLIFNFMDCVYSTFPDALHMPLDLPSTWFPISNTMGTTIYCPERGGYLNIPIFRKYW